LNLSEHPRLTVNILAIGADFSGLRFQLRRCLGTRSSIKYAANVIANSTTRRSAKWIAGPATFRKLPNFISKMRSLVIVRSFWSDMVVHNEVAKFCGIDITERDLFGIDLVKSLGKPDQILLQLQRARITSYDVIPKE
jgi:hypothetical protein